MDMRSQLKHQTYLAMAQQLSGLSTCLRLHVGCVLLRLDGSVAGVGYNGALPHKPHCAPETPTCAAIAQGTPSDRRSTTAPATSRLRIPRTNRAYDVRKT